MLAHSMRNSNQILHGDWSPYKIWCDENFYRVDHTSAPPEIFGYTNAVARSVFSSYLSCYSRAAVAVNQENKSILVALIVRWASRFISAVYSDCGPSARLILRPIAVAQHCCNGGKKILPLVCGPLQTLRPPQPRKLRALNTALRYMKLTAKCNVLVHWIIQNR